MKAIVRKNLRRIKRRRRVRGKVFGTSERPRLTVYKSLRHMYAQIVDDENMVTMASISTLNKEVGSQLKGKSKTDQAALVGENIARLSIEKGIKVITFDRNGWPYHGRIKSLADAARKAGLEF